MKLIYFFFLISFSLFALEYPQHQEVNSHNNAIAPHLLNSSCINRSEPTYENPIICSEIELLTVYPSVDYRISGERNASILWRYAYDASSKDRKITDDYGCVNYYHKTFQNADLYANLSAFFRNESNIHELNITDNPIKVPIPLEILNRTENDNITLVLDGKIIFHYILDKTISNWICDENNSCSCVQTIYPSESFNITSSIRSTLVYEVEGGSLLHFLNKPLLGEQWAKNSRLEDLVFSKRKFSRVLLLLENSNIGNASFYTFEIDNVSDNSDAWRIISHPIRNFTSMNATEILVKTLPNQIQKQNETFAYIYVFNSTYQFLGIHNMTINLNDHFENNFSKTFTIVNRLLTANNEIAENQETNISTSSKYRPSVKFVETNISFIIANLSLIGMIFLVFIIFRLS